MLFLKMLLQSSYVLQSIFFLFLNTVHISSREQKCLLRVCLLVCMFAINELLVHLLLAIEVFVFVIVIISLVVPSLAARLPSLQYSCCFIVFHMKCVMFVVVAILLLLQCTFVSLLPQTTPFHVPMCWCSLLALNMLHFIYFLACCCCCFIGTFYSRKKCFPCRHLLKSLVFPLGSIRFGSVPYNFIS